MVASDNEWVRIDLMDDGLVTTLCGFNDGKQADRKSLNFVDGKIVNSSEPT